MATILGTKAAKSVTCSHSNSKKTHSARTQCEYEESGRSAEKERVVGRLQAGDGRRRAALQAKRTRCGSGPTVKTNGKKDRKK